MKHLRLLLMMVVAANIAFVSSCKKDEDDDTPVNENPSISLAGDQGNVATDVTLEPAEEFKFTLSAARNSSTKSKLQNILITAEVGGVTNTVVDSTFNEDTFGPVTWTLNALTIETTQTWTFTVTDKAGKTATTGFTITTEAPVNSTPLGSDVTGQFYHVQGTLKGAYDLVNDVEKAAGDPNSDKDMKNTDPAGPFTGSFQAENATRYSKTTESYANILTVEKATELYNGGGIPAADVLNPKAGDVYVVKLRDNSFAVLRIDSVDPADNTCSCVNTGKISFTYKK